MTARTIAGARAMKRRSMVPKVRVMLAGVALLPSSAARRAAALTIDAAAKNGRAKVPRNCATRTRTSFRTKTLPMLLPPEYIRTLALYRPRPQRDSFLQAFLMRGDDLRFKDRVALVTGGGR